MDEIASAVMAARRLYEERRCRDRLLGPYATLMGEPVWDMLLALFTADDQGSGRLVEHRNPVSPELAVQSAAVLHRLGLVERPNMVGRTSGVLQLSATGVAIMTRVVSGSAAEAPSPVDR